jgi:hypothetical protein
MVCSSVYPFHSILRVALLSLPPLISAQAADLRSAMPPGGNFDLGHWALTVPADENGYYSDWFHTSPDGAMTFWAPVTGSTKGGSSHARSELREVLDPSDNSVNWSDAGISLLWAQCKVMRVPSNGRVVEGQVHGYNTNPLILIEYDYDAAAKTGKLTSIMETFPGADPHDAEAHVRTTLASNIALGQTFSYQIQVSNNGSNGVVSAFVNNGTPASMVMDPLWDNETFYFKAGSYPQDDEGTADEGGEVRFYRLVASHPNQNLKVTTKSALPNATAGSPYYQALQASGGSGTYTWSLASGLLPAGLVLEPAGVIKGKTIPGSGSSTPHQFSTLTTDEQGNTAAKTFSLTVDPDAGQL